MTTTNTLELRAVSGRDSPCAPVHRVDLDADAGESLVILGPPGSGKASLLRLIAGFGELAGGAIRFNGHDLAGVAAHRRPFTLLTEQDALFPHMSVARNVAYGLASRSLEAAAIAARVDQALAVVEATELKSARPETISPAERQLVALARALAVEPAVLLMGDALDRLDQVRASRILARLRDLQRRVGLTLVAATGDGAMAMAMADRIAVMQEGRITETGRPGTLYAKPATALAARLTGTVNLVPCNLPRPPGSGPLRTAPPGADRILVLRPDAVELHLAAPGESRVILEGRVDGLSFSVDGLSVRVRVPGMDDVLVARVDRRRLDADDFPEGRHVWCTWDPETAHTVPSES